MSVTTAGTTTGPEFRPQDVIMQSLFATDTALLLGHPDSDKLTLGAATSTAIEGYCMRDVLSSLLSADLGRMSASAVSDTVSHDVVSALVSGLRPAFCRSPQAQATPKISTQRDGERMAHAATAYAQSVWPAASAEGCVYPSPVN